jgi:hypothetical protein
VTINNWPFIIVNWEWSIVCARFTVGKIFAFCTKLIRLIHAAFQAAEKELAHDDPLNPFNPLTRFYPYSHFRDAFCNSRAAFLQLSFFSI